MLSRRMAQSKSNVALPGTWTQDVGGYWNSSYSWLSEITAAAQGFKVQTINPISKVRVYFMSAGTCAFRVETDNGGKPSGTLVSPTASGEITTLGGSLSEGELLSPFTPQVNTQYWLVLTKVSGNPVLGYGQPGIYSYGNALCQGPLVGPPSSTWYIYGSQPPYDRASWAGVAIYQAGVEATTTTTTTTTIAPSVSAIPIMTSNTTPSGIASCSSLYTGRADWAAWKCMDGDHPMGTSWCHTDGTEPGWIQYKFASSKIIKRFTYTLNGVQHYLIDWQFQSSNNGSSWTTLDSATGFPSQAVIDRTFANSTAYLYYRIYCTRTTYRSTNPYLSCEDFKMYT
jgi:hypothetical protein